MPIIDNLSKSQILNNPVKHIDFASFEVDAIIDQMKNMGFTSRELARATKIYEMMLSDENCVVALTLAGSTSAAGCMNLYADLIKYNMVDIVVATGASIVDMDFFEALGFKHYQGASNANDSVLRSLHIDRIYDTYIDEDDLRLCDATIKLIADELSRKSFSSREFIREMGRWLSNGNAIKPNSLVQLAYEHDVPVFCPAFTDSSAGFGLVMHQEENPINHITLDSVKDFRELTEIKMQAKTSGMIMVGGGVPKNFWQDTVVCAEMLGKEVPMHQYSIQVTVADVRDGSCSSSTLKEALSWGKVNSAYEQMVFAEATSVLPLMMSYVFHKNDWTNKRKRRHLNRLFL